MKLRVFGAGVVLAAAVVGGGTSSAMVAVPAPWKNCKQVNNRFRGQGLVEVLAAGEVEGHLREAPSHWLLTDEGRAHVDRLRLN
jgi:hypothetical protein